MLRDLARHAAQLVVEELALDQVALERVLHADRDACGGMLEPPRVEAARAVAEQRADRTREQPAQVVVAERGEAADRADARGAQASLRFRADARELAHVERRKEAGLLA